MITKKNFCNYSFLKYVFQMQAVEISRTDYEPSDMDILYADGITSSNSLTSMEFSFPKSTQDDPEYQHDPSLRSVLLFHSFIISCMSRNALILIKIN
jgi:hypothetical protein